MTITVSEAGASSAAFIQCCKGCLAAEDTSALDAALSVVGLLVTADSLFSYAKVCLESLDKIAGATGCLSCCTDNMLVFRILYY